MRFTISLLALSAACFLTAETLADGADAAISVPAGASLGEAIAIVGRQTGKLVLSEATAVDHRPADPIKELPLSRLVPKLTEIYHLHAMVEPERLLLVRRFLDPRERPDAPIPELAGITRDLYKLVSPLSPRHINLASSRKRRDFYRSLSVEQIAAAQRGELSYGTLSSAQRRLWGVLTADFAFNTLELELRRSAALFHHWKQSSLFETVIQDQTAPRASVWFRHPYVGEGEATRSFEIWRQYSVDDSMKHDNRIGPVAGGSWEVVGRSSRSSSLCPRGFEPKVQPVALADLVRGIGKANEVSIQVPDYARNRRYYIYCKGHSGSEILQALASLSGWEVRSSGKGKLKLDRVRVKAVSNALDYFEQVRRIVPPALRVMANTDGDTGEALKARQGREFALLVEQLAGTRLADAGTWPVKNLEPEWQRRLANILFERTVLFNMRSALVEARPPGWLVAPERGVFLLKGPVGKGKRPMLQFLVPRERSGDRVTYDMWGWIINSSSLGGD